MAPWEGGRVALVHDWFQGFHGSERVVEAMVSDVLRDAREVDLFTFHAARELLPGSLSQRIVAESRLASLPGIRQVGHEPGRWRYLLPAMPRYFRSLELGGYDLVIASSHACAVNAAPPETTPYVCYCYTPIRYAWMPGVERERVGAVAGLGLRLTSAWLRRTDLRASRRPDSYMAISEAVRERIERFYHRDADVIHPPVDVDELAPASKSDPATFLWVNRLVSYKRPEPVIEAFRRLPYRLTMVGIGPLEDRLRATLPSNVELLGWLPRERLLELYSQASGYLHVGEEDFGIAMVEALAAGAPVIGLDAGGARDIVRDGVDGILLPDPTVERIRAAVERVAEGRWDPAALADRAREFSRARFAERMRASLAAAMDDADRPAQRQTSTA